jgi:hypothetical protein
MVRNFGALLSTIAVVAFGWQSAHAEEYGVTTLGDAPVSYIEHRFDINASGRAAFTALVGGDEHAVYTDGGGALVDLHTSTGNFGSDKTRAESINDAGHIVGYRRTGPAIFREAMLWYNSGSSYSSSLDLHNEVPAGPGEDIAISAAYDISNATAGAGAAYVAGYMRETFQTPSEAVLWTIDSGGSVVSSQTIPLSSGMNYNIAYGVNDDGMVVGGEGMFGGSSGGGGPGTAMYAFIYDSVADVTTPVPGVQASDGYRTSVAVSVSENYVVGYALNDSTGYPTAFVHELGTSTTETDIMIGPNGGQAGPRSLGYSVREDANGPVIYGLSEVNGALNSMGGLIYDREGSNVQECDINFSGDWSGRVTHLYAMNDSGQGIGLISDGGVQAVYIEDVTAETLQADVFMRDLENPGATDYYWGRVQDPGGAVSGSAALMFSNAPGCGSAFSCDGTTGLSDEGVSGTDYFVTGSGAFSSGTAFTAQFNTDPTSFDYSQAFANTGGTCQFNDVQDMTGGIPSANINPPGVDPWGDEWADCTPHINAETNIDTSLDNCGSCGNSVDDGKVCTSDTCADGTPQNTYDTSSDFCFISNNCVPNATDSSDPAATNPSNECEACYTNQDRFAYSDDPDGSSCSDDGLSCTVDQCQNGTCNHDTIAANSCLIGGTCYTDGQDNPSNECEACQSGSSDNSFTDDPNGTTCTDNDGYACTVAECQGGNCDQRADFTGCQIGSDCYSFGQERPGNECQACQSSNPEGWTNDDNGTGCDTDSCYTSQTCSSGTCGGGSPVVDSYEQDDIWQDATFLGSWNEDHFWTGGSKPYRAENKTIFPENDDDWYRFYADDYHCMTETYSCNCSCNNDWWGNCDSQSCSTCTRATNCTFGGTRSSNWGDPGTNENPQGKVELVVPSGSDYNVCVYLQCNSDGNTPNSINWFGNGSATGNVTINGKSLKGRCGLNGGSTTETIEFHPDCNSENDSVQAFVRVYDQTNNARCNSTYQIRVGNDKD